ncbi:efflux RND transporter periplasmic adaptor subunit [Chitinophaga arvensicola]|uniref:Membrane fusion protein, cobalt-zinc-cadmium efflux system n=1 Tax=Chitinophaga arvensicola TaxID=29529 RepID=A0A1I0SBB2_9BACT|nr:efflux RND transporter periplasmic adaptor subunit [Chitinophaga arvensicola]SEW53811.1 membrane fusion protein, cobalt-zinc-cadmium efflux system [Chitinophaga arvensicola]
MKTFIIIVCSLGIMLPACKENKPADKAPESKTAEASVSNEVQLTPEQIKTAGIVIHPAENRNMHTVLKVNGVVDVPPQNIVSVSMPLGGYLKSMHLLPGMQIAKGQVMATLEDPQYIQLQEDYLIAKSKLRFLEADFVRQKELNESKANSDKVFQQVRSEYEAQKVMAGALREKLQLININPDKLSEGNITRSVNLYAPISGFITRVNVNTGKYVNPTDVLFELINPGDLHLSLTVFENDLQQLAEGQKVTCFTTANGGKKYGAKVHLITRNVDANRSGEVHCHFDQYDKSLIPGMFMNAEIEMDNAHVSAVPDDAVVKWENKQYIFVAVTADKFVMTPVQTGTSNGGFTEIKTDLSDKKIVTENAYSLLMKMKNSGEE